MTFSLRAARAAALLPLLVAPLLLSACSSSAGGTQPESGAQRSAEAQASKIATAQGKTFAPPAGGITTGDQLCKLVPAADAAAALQTSPPVARSGSGTFINGEPQCGYADDGPLAKKDGIDTAAIGVTVIWGDAKNDPFVAGKPVMGSGAATAVSGVGDAAQANGQGELDVKTGDHTLILISAGRTDLTQAQLVALAKVFVARA